MTSKQFAPVLAQAKFTLDEFMQGFHHLPDAKIYHLKELLQQGQIDQAKQLLPQIQLPEALQGVSDLLNQNNSKEALNAVSAHIEQEEGHLARITDTAARLMPRLVTPLGKQVASTVTENFCSEPSDVLAEAYEAVDAIARTIKQKSPPSETQRNIAAQALSAYVTEQESEEPVCLATLVSALQGTEPLDEQAVEKAVVFLLEKYQEAEGVVGRIVDAFWNTIERRMKRLRRQILPQIINAEAAQPPPELTAISHLLSSVSSSQSLQTPLLDDYTALIDIEAKRLGENAACFFAADAIVRSFGGLPISHRFILQCLDECARTGASFNEKIFAYPEFQNLSFFRRFLIKGTYYLAAPLIGLFVRKAVDRVVKYALSLIDRHSTDNYNEALESSIKLINEHAANLNDAYNIICGLAPSKRPDGSLPFTGTPCHRLQEEMSSAAYRKGMSRDAFFSKVAEAIVERFCPVFDWRDRCSFFLASLRFDPRSLCRFFNPLLAAFFGSINLIARLSLALPEMAINATMRFTIKRLLIREGAVGQAVASLKKEIGLSGGYAYYLNVFVLGKLQTAWEQMAPSIKASIDLAVLEKTIPKTTKTEMTGLVSTFFRVIEKQDKAEKDLDTLTEFCRAKQPLQFLQAFGSKLVMEEAKVMRTTVGYMAGLVHLLFQKPQLQQALHYSLLALSDDFFSLKDKPSTSDQMAAQNETLNFLNKILAKAIRDAVTEKCRPIIGIQREATKFVAFVKEQTTICIDEAKEHLAMHRFSQLTQTFDQLKAKIANALAETQNAPQSKELLQQMNQCAESLASCLDTMAPALTLLQNASSLQEDVGAAFIGLGFQIQELTQWKESLSAIEIPKEDPGPLDPLVDPAIEAICKELKKRTDIIPDFMAKPYNWEGLATQFLFAFLEDRAIS